MRKNIHPYLKETIIQTKDGSSYVKHWLYFRNFLPLEIDYTKNLNWKNTKKVNVKVTSLSKTKDEKNIK